MSVIHDALKKAGQPIITQEQKKVSSAPIHPEIMIHKKRSSFNGGPLFVLLALVFIAGPFLLPMLGNPLDQADPGKIPARESSVSMGEEVSNKLGQFAIEETAVRTPAPSWTGVPARNAALPEFTLSGVVYSDYESYCLINGKVLRVGETVGDAAVESITQNSVTLNRFGEKIIVPVTA